MIDALIFDTVRTPRGKGKKNGALNEVPPIQLASKVLQAIEKRNNINTEDVDDVVLGCVHPIGEQGADIARTAVLEANWHQTVSGVQVDRFCASGLEAVNIAAAQIMSGQSDLSVGGGVESMSRVPLGSSGGAWMADPTVAYNSYFVPQGISADLLATKYNYSRTDVDNYAVSSQKRAAEAWKEQRFKNSIIPINDQNNLSILEVDEYMRPDTTMQSLGALEPSFKKMGGIGFDDVAILKYPELESINHIHHAGNSSGIVDGAAGVLIGNKKMGNKYELKARAKIRSFASIGSEPTIMLTGPADSAEKALRKANMKASDIDLFEMNEAFAAVVLRFMDVLKVDHSKVNVNGGAIALGHPLGATGAIILGTVLDELERRDLTTGLVTLCVGAGMGTTTIIERI
ncbi:MAG: acetyl-CoA C-acetyltransferase [Alphaproteobacteria bacterium]|jgi:acetyl-CoA C-acetyltransferase|tara:strand:+ start:207 stop:1412 length:1206 start_codon:yes stop_codon:yes gene_type:complete